MDKLRDMLSALFKDGIRLIEGNLSPFDIYNLRIARCKPRNNLRACSVKDIARYIDNGVDFRIIPIYFDEITNASIDRQDSIYHLFLDTICRRKDPIGYIWLSKLSILNIDLIFAILISHHELFATIAELTNILSLTIAHINPSIAKLDRMADDLLTHMVYLHCIGDDVETTYLNNFLDTLYTCMGIR